jgi:16S rRNA (uracil1498-N3)-methyltransferase
MHPVPVPRFFAPEARPGLAAVTLPPDEAHHLLHVLRLQPGARVGVFDGRGREWTGRVAATSRRTATIDLDAPVAPAAEAPVPVTLAVGLLKGDQMDAVVRDATMLGAAAIAPLISAHAAVPARAGRGAALDRWRRVAIASAKQCGRAVVPDLAPPARLETVLDSHPSSLLVMCVEPARAGSAPLDEQPPRPASAVLLVGPEGGWSAAEVDLAVGRGARLLQMGPRTLRAETAPVAALSLLWARWGW